MINPTSILEFLDYILPADFEGTLAQESGVDGYKIIIYEKRNRQYKEVYRFPLSYLNIMDGTYKTTIFSGVQEFIAIQNSPLMKALR